MSGAGKSSALKILEDLEYEAMDNLPVSLLPNVIDLALGENSSHVNPALAIGIDVRTWNFEPEMILETLTKIRQNKAVDLQILYFDSADDVLAHRFTETRRKHPLARDASVMEGVTLERAKMEKLRVEADHIIDTSRLSIHDLRQMLFEKFEREHGGGLSISIVSFAYPRGLPQSADLVFDVRFLRNPHYDPALRSLTGQDPGVCDYIKSDQIYDIFWKRTSELILTLLPEYKKEGRAYLTIAFGCTGGRHRSVCSAEILQRLLKKNDYQVNLYHRELSQDK